jgi:hypothetical protein
MGIISSNEDGIILIGRNPLPLTVEVEVVNLHTEEIVDLIEDLVDVDLLLAHLELDLMDLQEVDMSEDMNRVDHTGQIFIGCHGHYRSDIGYF